MLEDQPLGYLLYRVANALRAEVTAAVLEPLGLALPAIHLHADPVQVSRGGPMPNSPATSTSSPQAMNMVLRRLEEPRIGLPACERVVRHGRYPHS